MYESGLRILFCVETGSGRECGGEERRVPRQRSRREPCSFNNFL